MDEEQHTLYSLLMLNRLILLIPLAALGCARSSEAPVESPVLRPTPDLLVPDGEERFQATVEIDEKPGGKMLQAVWLKREDGDRWVISYRADPLWQVFEGKRVWATGEQYSPRGQAIGATHFRVNHLRVVDPAEMTSLVEVGPEQDLEGRFEMRQGEEGSKLADESWMVFAASGGTTYQIVHGRPETMPDGSVRVKARSVERSPFAAHLGGAALWILDVKPAEKDAP